MRVFNRLQAVTGPRLIEINLGQAKASSFKEKLVQKFWDSYLLMMGIMLCMMGLVPVTIISMQY
jgi:hypothetical protein